jgi:hypothetical protein
MDPIASALALLALLGFSASAWGWGRMALSVCRLEAQSSLAYPAVLGLAALAALGGWLNLFNIAYPPLLWMILTGGWIAALRRIRMAGSAPWRRAASGAFIVHGGVIALVAVFLAFTLLPSAAFNPYDDFQLYFPRPVRMLQTGSLGHNPFDPIGFDSLGSYAFLQAFTLLAFPLQYINALDAVLSPVLAMALVARIGRSLSLDPLVTLAGMAVLLLVPPQQVNTSPVYATAALSLALVPAALAHLDRAASWRSAVPAGLLVAAIIGLKITTVTFLLPVALLFLGGLAKAQGWRVAGRSAAAIAGWTAIFLAPWLALHIDHYASWLRQAPAGAGFGIVGDPSVFLAELRLRWGGTVMQFNAIAAVALAAALAGAIRYLRVGSAAERQRLLPLLALSGGAAAAYLVNALPYDVHHAVRYSAPILLVGAAAGILLIGFMLPRPRARAAGIGLVAGAAILLAGVTGDRVRKALDYRTVLSFPERDLPQFAVLAGWGLSREVQEWVRKAQAATRPGEPILALIACPYDLLFARNPVFVASEFGLSTPWIGVPLDADAGEIRRFLLRHGVRYVIWQVRAGMQTDEQLIARLGNPYPVDRRLARNLLSFRRSLTELTRASGVIHLDDGLIVVDLGERRK